jgi:hypothetical protein
MIQRISRLSLKLSPCTYSLLGPRAFSVGRSSRRSQDHGAAGTALQGGNGGGGGSSSGDVCTSVAFSPFFRSFFLVGFGSGRVVLFQQDSALPRCEWWLPQVTDAPAPAVVDMAWSSFRPSVFFVLDAGGGLHMWELLRETNAPALSVALSLPTAAAAAASAADGLSGQQQQQQKNPVRRARHGCVSFSHRARVGPSASAFVAFPTLVAGAVQLQVHALKANAAAAVADEQAETEALLALLHS